MVVDVQSLDAYFLVIVASSHKIVVAHPPTPYWTNGPLYIWPCSFRTCQSCFALCSFNVENIHPSSMLRIYIQQTLQLFLIKRRLESTRVFILLLYLSFYHILLRATCKFLTFFVFLFQYGVAIRSGHHCAQPLHRYLGINASVCASFHFYNTKDVDAFIRALKGTIDFFISSS
ncbi:hypothetical protein IFM89_033537 [Coptis chinensis]|uniref:Aminotransferase class V domain-containing protein n=1 Tax=Coptis chinensis TaxID=261450 RepID=A0A835HA75_9MAGN|nr:hypothetical protein IFM89_033537 [Coptis chinensis]